jgi:hypothetical protein
MLSVKAMSKRSSVEMARRETIDAKEEVDDAVVVMVFRPETKDDLEVAVGPSSRNSAKDSASAKSKSSPVKALFRLRKAVENVLPVDGGGDEASDKVQEFLVETRLPLV